MHQRDRITWLVTIAALVVAVFAIGGAHRLSVVALGLLSAGAAALQITSQRRLSRRSPLMLLLAVAVGLTALQLVPLPAALVELLHPEAYELIADGSRLAGSGEPVFLPLSLDPAGTLFELVKLCSYLALAYVLLRMSASERGRIRVFTAVAAVIGVAAAIGLIHKLLEANTLYGLYRPRYAYAEFLGPLLNRNHFASLLAVGTLVSAGLALRARVPMAHRMAWAAVGLLCLVESLLIQSRGAAVGLALGLGVSGGLLLLQRWFQDSTRKSRRPELAKVTIPATIVVLCCLTMVVYFSAGGVGEQLTETRGAELAEPRSKFMAWRSASQLLEDSPWIGVGRGAFESAFTRVHPSSGLVTFSHLENEYLQTAVDWGVPGALAMAFILAWTGLIAVRRWNSGALAAAGLGVMVTVAAHSVVDFGLELPGLAVPILFVLATLTHVPVVEIAPGRSRRTRLLRGGAVALAGAASLLLLTPLGRTLHEDHNRLREQDVMSADLAREAMDRHPVDYLATAYVAAALFEAGDIEARRLLNHALILHPTHPELHRLAARMLLRSGRPGQALVEYHLAIRATRNPVDLIRELVRRFPAPDQAVKALPVDHPHPRRIARILVDEKRPDVALPYLKRVVHDNPKDLLTFKLLGEIAPGLKDHEAVELAARRLAELEPTQDNLLSLARILHVREKQADAEKAVKRALEKRGSAGVLLEANVLLADIYIAAKNWTAARQHLTSLREQPDIYLQIRSELHRRMAIVEDGLGNPRQAEWERERARGP
ncbi:MAG TPA: O-antigen ligase family protein [Kofleriaceae bacterium]|nr:O-antigen ligase family protein [Kofleriaceae bacterium]